MRIAFHAPMKPPDDPVPSGDRQAARMLMAALAAAGHQPTIASRLVTWLGAPDEDADGRLAAAADAEAERLLAGWREGLRPALWLTYHLYHKAPDRLGPRIAEALDIPYAVVEASRAAKRATGPWSKRLGEVDAALAAADAVVAVHAEDAEGLAAVVPAGRLWRLPPFLDAAPFAAAAAAREVTETDVSAARGDQADGVAPRLLAVGMMREGDKARSYAVLADALGRLADRPWSLTVVGDGPARATVADAFDAAGIAGRITFLGALPTERMPAVFADADLLVWPAINEAYGFVFLEAQAAGLPVVGARRGGIPEIVRAGETGLLAPEGDAPAFADAVGRLLDDAAARCRMGRAAAGHIARDHDLAPAARRLDAILAAAVDEHAGRPRCAR